MIYFYQWFICECSNLIEASSNIILSICKISKTTVLRYVVCLYPILETDACISGDVRLVTEAFNNSGRVEICVGGEWGTICATSLSSSFAKVACFQVGFSGSGMLINRICICARGHKLVACNNGYQVLHVASDKKLLQANRIFTVTRYRYENHI